jgi:putative addiction module component (TIGR02574 family)
MSPSLADVVAAAELLTIDDRRALVDLLIEELDGTPPSEAAAGMPALSAAWQQEIARRSAELDSGQGETVPWPEVKARLSSQRPTDG